MRLQSHLVCTLLALSSAVVFPARGQVAPQPLTPVAQAAKQLQDDQAALKKAQDAVAAARKKVKDQYLLKPEWAPVSAALTKAQADAKTAESAALTAVKAKPEYAALAEKRAEANKIQATAAAGSAPGSDDPKVSDADLRAAADASLAAAVEMKTMEKQALASDPAYVSAKARVDENNAKMAQLDAEIDELLKTDTNYQTLVQTVASAQQQVDTDKTQLASARQQATPQHPSPSGNQSVTQAPQSRGSQPSHSSHRKH